MTSTDSRPASDNHDESPASNSAAYALGALDDSDAAELELHVASDESAARELSAMLDTVAAMSMMVGQAEPEESLKLRILAAVDAEAEAREQHATASLLTHIESQILEEHSAVDEEYRPWYRKLTDGLNVGRLAFATSIAAFMVATIVAIQLGADNASLNRRVSEMARSVEASTEYANMVLRELEDARRGLTAAEVRMQQQATQIEEMSVSNDALRESFNDQISLTYATLQQQYRTPDWLPDSSAYSSGYMYLLESRFGSDAALVIGGVAPAPPGEEYRLYLVSGDDAQHAASFNMNQAGYGTVTFSLPAPLSTFDGAHITRELITDPPDPTLALPENRYRPQ